MALYTNANVLHNYNSYYNPIINILCLNTVEVKLSVIKIITLVKLEFDSEDLSNDIAVTWSEKVWLTGEYHTEMD